MTLEQLRIFVAVAKWEHITRAARDIHLTQSATSAAIAALETRHNTRLFDRVGRRIELTEAGRLFLREAQAVLDRAAAAEAMLAELAGLQRGTLQLGASQTVANYWLPPIMHRFRARHPNIDVCVRIGNTASVAGWILENEADIGFVEGQVDSPWLHATPVADDEVVLVVGAGHHWAGRASVALHELSKTPWVLREPGSGTRGVFVEALEAGGLDIADMRIVMELPSNEAVRAAVEAGAGASVMSRLVVQASLDSGLLSRPQIKLPGRKFLMLRHKDRCMTAAKVAFYALVDSS